MSNLPADQIRYRILTAREGDEGKARDEKMVSALADALIEARRTGSATQGVMIGIYGFTAEELTRYGTAAKDIATREWMINHLLEEAA